MKRWIIAGALLWAAACTSRPEPATTTSAPVPAPTPTAAAEEAVTPQVPDLYYSLEIRRGGQLVAKPKLLGESGKSVRAERRQPGAQVFDYRLVVQAQPEGRQYRVSLDVTLPGSEGHTELLAEHAQVRRLELGAQPGDLQVSFTLMRVDSPEFRALMQLNEEDEKRANARSI